MRSRDRTRFLVPPLMAVAIGIALGRRRFRRFANVVVRRFHFLRLIPALAEFLVVTTTAAPPAPAAAASAVLAFVAVAMITATLGCV